MPEIETDETTEVAAEETTGAEAVEDPATDADDSETYPASVVRDLREKNGRYRTRTHEAEARADSLARQLFTARVEATGKLTAAADLGYDAELLDDAEALNTAIYTLIAERPHYAKRTVTGSVGQGVKGTQDAAPTFGTLLQQHI